MSANGIQPLDDTPGGRTRGPVSLLTLAAAAIGAICVIGAVATVVLLVRDGRSVSAFEISALAGLLLLGVAGVAAALLAARAGQQVRRLIDHVAALEQRTAILAEQSVARTQREADLPPQTVNPAEMRALLIDIRDILLLPQDLRLRRYQAAAEAEFRRRLEATDRFIASRDFHRARDELTALANRFGEDDQIREARTRLERAAEEARAQDITQAVTRAQDLMSLGRWEETEQLARELADKYPAAPEPAALLEKIARERRLFEQRHRQRMLDEIQQLVRQRRWREAADGTRRFLQILPLDIEATPLREQLKTLDANAEIQNRQLLEQQYKELLAQHRYWDALGLARRIIGEYPFSPQANALRGQVARLEELARRHEPQA